MAPDKPVEATRRDTMTNQVGFEMLAPCPVAKDEPRPQLPEHYENQESSALRVISTTKTRIEAIPGKAIVDSL